MHSSPCRRGNVGGPPGASAGHGAAGTVYRASCWCGVGRERVTPDRQGGIGVHCPAPCRRGGVGGPAAAIRGHGAAGTVDGASVWCPVVHERVTRDRKGASGVHRSPCSRGGVGGPVAASAGHGANVVNGTSFWRGVAVKRRGRVQHTRSGHSPA
eukprot:2627912-Rhodomonas_salina.3